MKIIKTYEEWSPKFNRTLQGAAALATSTNKPDQKKQSIEDYANRSINKEEFMIKRFNDRDELLPNVYTIVHDPKFILKPIEKFASVRSPFIIRKQLSIPVILKYYKKEDGTIVPTEEEKYMLTFTEDGSIYIKSSKDWKWDVNFPGHKIKFVDRASIENFIAMAIQAITSSPEPGSTLSPEEELEILLGNKTIDSAADTANSGMTKEKQDILDLIQKIVLDKDMRSFTM
jgi:hypothetical protein